jgi:hypothetical protein
MFVIFVCLRLAWQNSYLLLSYNYRRGMRKMRKACKVEGFEIKPKFKVIYKNKLMLSLTGINIILG